jgi:hypothetical protein
VEGCVRETFGAAVAQWQASAAADAGVRRSLRTIAADEARHAALSWRAAGWLEKSLSPSEREDVVRARAQAVEKLRLEAQAAPPDEVVRIAGVPVREHAVALVDALNARLWSDSTS